MNQRSKETILITGGAGFIGTHLAERLCDRANVVLFDNFRRDSLSAVPFLRSHPGVRVVNGDVLDEASIAGAMDGASTVLHLAAIAGVSSYYTDPVKTLRVNVLGTVNVLEQCVRQGVRVFVDFSTSEIFGSMALFVDETSPSGIGPSSDRRWSYATSKLASEQFALRYGEQHGFAAAVVRPFNIYGPRQTGEGAISNFCGAAARGEPLRVIGEGTSLRAWCYVSDLVDAVVAMLDMDDLGGQSFNLGNPAEVDTTIGLARRVARLAPGTEIEFKEESGTDVRARVPNITRAQQLLGFEPRVGLDEGIERTLAWFREQEGSR